MLPENPTAYPNVIYIFHPHHRNGNPNKSQWQIKQEEEKLCFESAAQPKYSDTNSQECPITNICWGLYVNEDNNEIEYLGISMKNCSKPNRFLVIAKFVDGNDNNKWHGYPADHELNSQDVPPECVLNQWLQTGLLPARKIRKLSRGQKCRL